MKTSTSRILWLTAMFIGFLALGLDAGYAAGIHAKLAAIERERIEE